MTASLNGTKMSTMQEIEMQNEFAVNDSLDNWYKSSEWTTHPHPKKVKVECSLDEDIISWLKGKVDIEEEYHIYINYFLKKRMEKEQGKI
jgi:hypothetical protein